MLGISAVPAILQFIGFLFLPESPRWLMKMGKETKSRLIMEMFINSKTMGGNREI
jgi:SP family myo-inositol transporter-like MFS transporter 13